MNLKPVFSFMVILFLFLALPFKTVFAQDASLQSQMINLKLEGVAAQGDTISGSVTIVNNSNKNFAQAYLVTSLLSSGTATTLKPGGQDITIQNPGQLISVDKSDLFSLTPGDTIQKSISFKYPGSVNNGKYNLTVEIKEIDGSSQGIINQQLDLSGTGEFLDITASGCRLKVNNKTFGLSEGPSVAKNETATLTCSVKNNTSQSIKAKPQVAYAINSVGDTSQPLSLDLSSQIIVGPGQLGVVNIIIPNNLDPQVYEGMLYLVNDFDQQISPHIPFRWVITGASAIIKNLDLDKSYYKGGENARVSVQALPSIDLVWRGPAMPGMGYSPEAGTDLTNPKVTLKITNADNQVCGQAEKTLPSTKTEVYWKSVEVDVPISIECKNPEVEAAVYEAGIDQPLAVLVKGQITTNSDLYGPLAKTSLSKNALSNPWIWLLGALVITGAITGFIFWKKRRKTPPSSPPASPPNTPPIPSPVGLASLAVFLSSILGLYLTGGNTRLSFITYAQQQFAPIQGLSKPPVNSNDANTKTVTMKKYYFHNLAAFGGNIPSWVTATYVPNWANARDFAQNNTGGDSQVSVSPDCTEINVTVNGTVGSDYMCGNWAPGIAIANFVDDIPVTPSGATSAINNQIIIPSLQIGQTNPTPEYAALGMPVYNNYSSYGPHIINVYDVGVASPKSITYQLKFPSPLAEGTHTLLLQAGTSLLTTHTGLFDRFFSSLEPVISTDDPGDFNCDGKEPCFMPLKYTFSCKAPPACNQNCSTQDDCKYAANGCVECRPNPEGQNTCQPPPPACNAACSGDRDCFGNKDGCSTCVNGSCKVPPACNSNCTNDSECSRAIDGCTACVGGVCKPPPACGTACTTKAECSGVKDGCSECLEGTCTDFSDNMCKCDGMVADLDYPNNFNFEAFGKVEGADTKKAQIADITFRLTRDNQVVAKSNPITPQIVENTSDKVRFKASWSTPPPAVVTGATYRVFADVRCKPKKITASTEGNFTPNPEAVAQVPKSRPPLGLQWAFNLMNKLFNGKDWIGKAVIGDVMAQLASPSPSANSQSNLQLSTLNFVKLLDTDNCRFVMFKFDETLF